MDHSKDALELLVRSGCPKAADKLIIEDRLTGIQHKVVEAGIYRAIKSMWSSEGHSANFGVRPEDAQKLLSDTEVTEYFEITDNAEIVRDYLALVLHGVVVAQSTMGGIKASVDTFSLLNNEPVQSAIARTVHEHRNGDRIQALIRSGNMLLEKMKGTNAHELSVFLNQLSTIPTGNSHQNFRPWIPVREDAHSAEQVYAIVAPTISVRGLVSEFEGTHGYLNKRFFRTGSLTPIEREFISKKIVAWFQADWLDQIHALLQFEEERLTGPTEETVYDPVQLREYMSQAVIDELKLCHFKRLSYLMSWPAHFFDNQKEELKGFSRAYSLSRETGEAQFPDKHTFMYLGG